MFQGKRKLIVALGAILAAALAPASAVSIAAIAVAFFGAHAVADSRFARPVDR